MKRKAGDVHPTEYAWREQFDIDGMGYVSMDVGKVRGLAQYAEELEAERDRLREALQGLLDADTHSDCLPFSGNCPRCVAEEEARAALEDKP